MSLGVTSLSVQPFSEYDIPSTSQSDVMRHHARQVDTTSNIAYRTRALTMIEAIIIHPRLRIVELC